MDGIRGNVIPPLEHSEQTNYTYLATMRISSLSRYLSASRDSVLKRRHEVSGQDASHTLSGTLISPVQKLVRDDLGLRRA